MKVLVFIFLLAGPMASTPTVAASTTHPPTTTTVPPDTTKSTPPTTTTTTPLTTTPPTTTPVLLATKIEIGFSMNETFTSDLADPTSEEFKVLADKVTSALNNVYANVTNFNKSFVTKFSKGSVVTKADLIFNQGSTVNATSAKETLVAAASSSDFDLTVHTASIVTAVLPTTTTTTPPTTTTPLKTTTPTTTTPLTTTPPTTTAPPTTATHPTTTRTTPPTASIPPTTTTTPSTTTASPSTSTALLTTKTASSTTTVPPTTTTTATTTPQTTTTTAPSPTTTTTTALNLPSNTEGIIFCQFKIDQVFIPALSDQSSSEYQSLAQKVLTELNRVGKKLYGGNYLRSLINSFKSGSVVVNSTLVFQSKCSVPEAVTAATQLNTELVNSTLNVIQGSVSAQSSGRSLHRTVVSMSILTLLLLAVTHILSDV